MRAVGDVVRGEACLFGGIALCVVLRPEGLAANNGMSYYGVHWLTVTPYVGALVGAALFIRRGLRGVAAATPAPEHVRRMADVFVALLIGIVLTPYTLGGAVDWAHRGLGAALFALQLVLGTRLVAWAHGDVLGVAFLLVQLGGGILAAVFVLQPDGLLIHGEATFQLGFGLLLVRVLPLVPSRAPVAGPPGREQDVSPATT
ncbi:hypothetical protein GCM10009530_48980 [Microbispora corallina]|uniref:Uncharacterized protein n=1 Tax=Microbispora corallina TaxID=83302 RepID=A0ABQ4FQR1_9ACTN|nr:hypothetical protein [Microbispora corallina]GIH37151.1 hypothetical protein Mco01_01510 [Microbispora corallina]